MRSAVLALAMVVAVNGFGDKVAERVARNILQRDDNSHVEMGQPKKHAKAKEGRQGKLPGDKCSRQCLAHSCESGLTLRWGKYCGIGHTGCEGEEPCDAYDGCCQVHDDCVGEQGMMETECHTALKTCLANAFEKEEPTHSPKCSAELITKTMSSGMDLANIFSNTLSNKGGGKKPFVPQKKNPKLTNKQYFGRRQEGKKPQKRYKKFGEEL